MSFIKSFFKGFLIVLFLPFYWLYAVIWFIAFRGKLNSYPRVKKDATAKHLILAVISLFVFALFSFESSNTSTQEASNEVVLRDTYMETAELLSNEAESTQEDIYSSLIDDDTNQAVVNVVNSKSYNGYDTDQELSSEVVSTYESSGGISPYYHPPVEDDYYSEPTYYAHADYEEYTESDNEYAQTPKDNSNYEFPSNENNNIDNSISADINTSNNDYNFNKYNNSEQQNTYDSWVLNTNTKKIHYPTCRDVKKIAPHNYSTSAETLDTLKAMDYDTCGHCFK